MAAQASERPPPPNTFGVPWPVLNEGLFYTDVVKPTNSASTLIQFYSSKYTSSAPLQGWRQRIRNGQITVDGEVVTDPESALRVGLVLVYHRLPWEEPDAPYLLEVLYEDDDVVALNKPSGLQVLPGGLFQQRTVLRQLQWRACKTISSLHTSKTSVAEESHPAPIHRLGRGTSARQNEELFSLCYNNPGILLCAKTKHAKAHLASYFADGTLAVKESRLSKILFTDITKLFITLKEWAECLEYLLAIEERMDLIPGSRQTSMASWILDLPWMLGLLMDTHILEANLTVYFTTCGVLPSGRARFVCRRRTNKAKNVGADAAIQRKIFKLYRALVTGIIELDEVVIDQPIGVIHYPGLSKGLYVASSSGKPALSKVKVLERDIQRNQTLVQVEIQSGRPHQIRIHLAFIGHSLVGDPLYVSGGHPKCLQSESREDKFAEDGGYCKPVKPVPGDCGYYLHAHTLVFWHPSKNELIEILAPPPSMLQMQGEADKKIHGENMLITGHTGSTISVWQM